MVFRRRRGECGRLNNVAFGRSLVVLRWKFFACFLRLFFSLSFVCVLCARISGGKREKFSRVGANVEGFPEARRGLEIDSLDETSISSLECAV